MTASTDRLREAARVLRERAEGARSVWGEQPWAFTGLGWNDVQGTTYDVGISTSTLAGAATEETAIYIATMHPGVGVALAEWMDDTASRVEFGASAGSYADPLALADLILGAES